MVFLFGALFSGKASKMFPSVVMNFSEKDEENNNNINAIDSLQEPPKIKKKRNLPGNPDPDAEVIALSPKTLLATNRFECEVCQKGFQRDQNLQLHRRGHNLPWKLKQTNSSVIRKRAYVCPEPTCVHHHPSRALGDLTGIKKHFCRKHGEKKWKCEKCSKIYAVRSDWKAHSKTCGTREYRCDCGTLFSRKDNFTTHRAFCVALAKETARNSANTFNYLPPSPPHTHTQTQPPLFPLLPQPPHQCMSSSNPNPMWDPLTPNPLRIKPENLHLPILPPPPHPSAAYYQTPPPTAQLSATTLLQKAASFGSHPVGHVMSSMASSSVTPEFMGSRVNDTTMWPKGGHHLTRDFLGLTKEECGQLVLNVATDANMQMRDTLLLSRVLEDCEFVAEPTWG